MDLQRASQVVILNKEAQPGKAMTNRRRKILCNEIASHAFAWVNEDI